MCREREERKVIKKKPGGYSYGICTNQRLQPYHKAVSIDETKTGSSVNVAYSQQFQGKDNPPDSPGKLLCYIKKKHSPFGFATTPLLMTGPPGHAFDKGRDDKKQQYTQLDNRPFRWDSQTNTSLKTNKWYDSLKR